MSGIGQLELRTPNRGIMLVVGAWFMLLGFGMAAVIVFTEAPSLVALFPSCFGLVGLCLLLSRRGVVVDRSTATVTTWWGVLVAFGKKSHPLDPSHHVTLAREMRGGHKSRQEVFPISLAGTAGAKPLEVLTPTSYTVARNLAEQLANHLEVALHDSSAGAVVIREAGTLDQPLRQRLLADAGPRQFPSAETPPRLLVSQRAEQTICVLPAGGFQPMHLPVMLGLGSFMIFPLVFIFMGKWPWPIAAAALAFCTIPLVVLLPGLLRATIGRDTLSFSPDGVALKAWGSPRAAKSIDATALEELIIIPPSKTTELTWMGRCGRLVARSDALSLEIGRGLSEEELGWLEGAICHALTAEPFGYRGKPDRSD